MMHIISREGGQDAGKAKRSEAGLPLFSDKEREDMCGIAGWIDWQEDLTKKQAVLQSMVETLALRGPDASGMYICRQAALGHRRLSVIDPEGGQQPMLRRRGDFTYVITYNGELYNTAELRDELTALGNDFTSTSDTEVLLEAFMEWGPQCVDRLNGIFAFAIWDERNQSLFLARDRLGVKPLFYRHKGNSLIFGSEIKAVLAHPDVAPEVDAEGLAEIFMVGPARTPGNGVFRGVNELKPGYCAVYNRQGLKVRQYWSLISKPHGDDFLSTLTKVRDLVHDAVTRQLISDVPLCTLLSGGLDSSVITAIASKIYKKSGRQLNTYSVEYVDNEKYFSENSFQPNRDAPWVERASRFLGTCHHEILLDTPELAGVLEQAARARDLPGMADVDTSLYLFSREIKKGATVGLSGECADEVFGGYPWFYREEMVRSTVFPWSTNPEMRLQWLSPELTKHSLFKEYPYQRYQEALAEVSRLPGEAPEASRMREIFYLSLTRWMPTLLDRKDRMSMAFGLELRVPFCDHRLVEYVWNVPWEMKNYRQREKGLLRQALTSLLPEDVLWRKKSPYPKTHNPSFFDTVRAKLLEVQNNPSSPILPLLDTKKIREFTETDAAKSPMPWFGQLMGGPQLMAYLVQVNAWMCQNKVRIVL
ncbi:MAG: asparagine synthase (glutamine-hydrolyzing) [Firmicutes bacterium]|nr:asparagine synthase (glutamine-hydrolyzing) [Bacillota bacterium]